MNEAVNFLKEHMQTVPEEIVSLIRPCINLQTERTNDDTIPIGSSKFGGRPDLPPDFAWPMTADGPCWFVAQVSLEDCATFDTGINLPGTGLLSFFFHDIRGRAGSKSKMFFFDTKDLQRTDIVPDTRYGGLAFHDRHFFPRKFNLEQGFQISTTLDFDLDLNDVKWDELAEAFNDTFNSCNHQIFGSPTNEKSGYKSAVNLLKKGYRLIASIGEVHDRYYYLVPEADLESMDFSRAKVIYGHS